MFRPKKQRSDGGGICRHTFKKDGQPGDTVLLDGQLKGATYFEDSLSLQLILFIQTFTDRSRDTTPRLILNLVKLTINQAS